MGVINYILFCIFLVTFRFKVVLSFKFFHSLEVMKQTITAAFCMLAYFFFINKVVLFICYEKKELEKGCGHIDQVKE